MTINDYDIENLKHTLGATEHTKKKNWGYRNLFCAGGDDIKSMQRLESEGLVREIKSSLIHPDSKYYIATEAGCKKLGFNKKQIANAMDF